MSYYRIIGGKPLKGSISPIPNKNSILKLIPAALLTEEIVTIHNVPKSTDVRLMLNIVKQLGGKVSYANGGETIKISAKELNTYEIDPELSQKVKASVMFMAPLLHRFKKASMPIPGGCKLGTRPLDAFIDNMVQMGAKYQREKGYFLEAENLKSGKIWSWFPSVTGTENLVMLACLIPGKTEIYNAAGEPHTQDLCNMLNAMGAKIENIGSNNLIIHGVEKMGIKAKISENDITVSENQKLQCQLTVRGDILDIKAFNWPLLPPDFIHIAIVCALKAKGSIIFQNTFYEYGFFFIEELAKMKAKVIMADPFRVITFGPTNFKGAKVFAPNIIQATMALFLAALSAEGETILEDRDDSLLRRYPDLVEKYKSLGAQVSRIGKKSGFLN